MAVEFPVSDESKEIVQKFIASINKAIYAFLKGEPIDKVSRIFVLKYVAQCFVYSRIRRKFYDCYIKCDKKINKDLTDKIIYIVHIQVKREEGWISEQVELFLR